MMDFFDEFLYPRQTLSLVPSFPSFYYPPVRPRYQLPDFSDFFEDEDDYEVFYPRQKVKPVRIPQLHLSEEKKGWIATVNLPGVSSFRDITLDLDDDTLRLRAEVRRRRQRRTYSHSLLLPKGADKSQIKASFRGETLTIVIPRMEEKQKLEQAAPEQRIEASPSSEKERVAEEKKEESASQDEKPQTVSVEVKQQPQQSITKRSLFTMPKVSHRQTDTHNVIAVEFPENWAAKDDLDVEVSNGMLNISFSKKDNGTTISFRRSVALPSNVTEQDITAKFENSTLTVSYPKPTPPKTFKIPLSCGDNLQKLDSSVSQPESQLSEASSQVESSTAESSSAESESKSINIESSSEKEAVTVESA